MIFNVYFVLTIIQNRCGGNSKAGRIKWSWSKMQSKDFYREHFCE